MKRPAQKVLLPVTRRTKIKPEPKWASTSKFCQHCEKWKMVDPDFGVINVRGKQYAAGWCKECRASEQYYNKPRKYRTKNNPG